MAGNNPASISVSAVSIVPNVEVYSIRGQPGPVGSAGPIGNTGSQGLQGSDGLQGTQGLQGLQGNQGSNGTQGLQGLQGSDGSQGTQGIQGSQGLQGIQGSNGTQGLQGLQGSDGSQGTQGIQGSQGLQGIQGSNGTQGLQGIQGQQGTQGLQGLNGATGTTGDPTGALSFSPQTTGHTLSIGDAGKVVEMNVQFSHYLTIPTNNIVSFPTGTQITVLQTGTGSCMITGSSGVVVNSKNNELQLGGQWSAATLIKRDTDTWVVVGDTTA